MQRSRTRNVKRRERRQRSRSRSRQREQITRPLQAHTTSATDVPRSSVAAKEVVETDDRKVAVESVGENGAVLTAKAFETAWTGLNDEEKNNEFYKNFI